MIKHASKGKTGAKSWVHKLINQHTPTNNPENQNLKKMKITLGDMMLLHMCNKNENHIMYVSCLRYAARHNLLSF